MLKQILRRYISIMLAVFMALSLIPATALPVAAATVNGLNVEGLEASYDKGTATGSGNSINFSATGSSGCGSSSTTAELTLKNNLSSAKELSFDYAPTLNGGTLTIDGNAETAGGSFKKMLDVGESIRIQVTTRKGDYTTAVALSNISLILDVEVETTFAPAEHGSFTVDGQAVTEEIKRTQRSVQAYDLKSVADAGYKFFDWYSTTKNRTLSASAQFSFHNEEEQTVTARFVAADSPIFSVTGARFTDLNDAVAYAKEKKAGKITLVSDGTLPAGSYEIPAGITLLIPFDEAETLYTTAPANTSTSYTTPKAFRTLTMAEGAKLNVAGAVSVSAKHAAAPGSGTYGGSPTGNVGFITMKDGSSIEIGNGGALYAWGFITGAGSVTARSGAKVYENFQIADFRGGSATSNLASGPIFPFSQYYVQNIEVPLTIESGATETVYSSLYAMGSPYSTSIEFIGANGMFKLAAGSSLKKTYDGRTDRLTFDLNGDAELKNLSVKVAVATVNSANFNLPINSNISIRIHSGQTTINQSLDLQPGSELAVDQGAVLKLAAGKKIYVYDRDEWGNYTMESQFIPVPYAPSRTYNRKAADLKDARIDLNGELVADGAVYTTESGADITSTAGTGRFTFAAAAGAETSTQQYSGNNTKVTIPVVSAKLHNNETLSPELLYTETAGEKAGAVYGYEPSMGVWTRQTTEVTVTLHPNYEESTEEDVRLTLMSGEEKELPAAAFTREGYRFAGWNTEAGGSGTPYADQEKLTVDEDTELYAQWEKLKFTVTWLDAKGQELMKSEGVEYGAKPAYPGETDPSKEETDEFTYTFKGWEPEITEETKITADTSYKAVFEETRRTYPITFKGDGDVVLGTQNVPYGEVPKFEGEDPKKASTDEFSYTFAGWDPDPVGVTGPAEYTATFTPAVREYDVTWVNWNDEVLQATAKVPYGVTPEYKGKRPEKPADEQYTYEFTDWDRKVEAVTGDVTYKAVFESTLRQYEISWQDEDGQELKSETVDYGTHPVYSGADPVKEGDEQYVYTFAGWNPAIGEDTIVTGNVVYKAEFSRELRKYSITWKVDEEAEGETVEAAYGTHPEYPGESDPVKADDEEYSYTFAGWEPEITEDTTVTADAVYTAKFDQRRIAFTVIWQNYNGEVLKTDTLVKEGTTPEYGGQAPAAPVRKWYEYSFTGWLPERGPITKDMTYTAQFEERGLTGWQTDEEGTTYIEDGAQKYFDTWAEVEGKTYFFNPEGYIVKGLYRTKDPQGEEYGTFVFDKETGVFRSELNGLYENEEDLLWIEEGRVAEDAGLQKAGEVYYYFGEDGKAFRAAEGTEDYLVTKTNGLLLPGGYRYPFGTDGIIRHDDTSWQGIHELDGTKYDYIDGVRIPRGLFERDGYFYYARSSNGELVAGRTYWVSVTNGLKDEGFYDFDEEARMVLPLRNGIVEENGSLYYYENGKLAPKGLIQIGQDYYYVRTSNGEVVHDRSYWVTVTNDLLPAGAYKFGSDGKMLNPPSEPDEPAGQDGIVEERGSLYYYENGKLAPKGLIQIGDDYYYVRTSTGEVVHGRSYWVTVTNQLLPARLYEFGDDGKMIR